MCGYSLLRRACRPFLPTLSFLAVRALAVRALIEAVDVDWIFLDCFVAHNLPARAAKPMGSPAVLSSLSQQR